MSLDDQQKSLVNELHKGASRYNINSSDLNFALDPDLVMQVCLQPRTRKMADRGATERENKKRAQDGGGSFVFEGGSSLPTFTLSLQFSPSEQADTS